MQVISENIAYMDFVPPSSISDAKEVFQANSSIVDDQDGCARIITLEGKDFLMKEGVTEVILGREKKNQPDYF